MADLEYIIVQAGGKGTRLQRLTKNKPKALVSINNLPMIFHLFKHFPKSNFIILQDYKADVMTQYLQAFATPETAKSSDFAPNYKLVNASKDTGTCAGLQEAISYVPDNKPFMLVWCDLILPADLDINKLDIQNKNYLGLSQDFTCRWSYQNKEFKEIPSDEFGVAGLFVFKNKGVIQEVDKSGEFVRWLSTQNIEFDTLGLKGGKEYGLLDVVKSIEQPKCRPFNKLTECIIKEGIDEQGKRLAIRERNWYSVVAKHNFKNLPKIFSLEPLIMEKINGGPIYTYSDLSMQDKKTIITKIVDCLKNLHKLGKIPADIESLDDNYIKKTIDRVACVQDLIPFAKDETIKINGKICKNFFYHIEQIKQEIQKYYPQDFVFLHGDSTFSNILLNENKEPVLIDPRGYFGKTELYGDVAYDWAKLYYSLYTNYDQFNLKNFDLTIAEDEVFLDIPENNWEDLKNYYISLIQDEVTQEQLNLILALIWISLTTYAWDDYDSICGAFYKGLLILNECEFMKGE